MVRVVSQNFSPPRSRHSSGETDRDLAERANLALSTLGRKRLEIPEYESSSDSFWDSELDGDHYDTLVSENGESSNDINGNEAPEKSDAQSRRKERRRERNKLSAQAYRQRRRHQNVKEQQQLMHLETENKRLHKLVQTLENKKVQAKQYLLGCSVPMPDILQPSGAVGGAAPGNAPVIPQDLPTPQLKVCDEPPNPHCHKFTNHHSPLSPSSACSSMSVDQALPSPPLALTHASKEQIPLMLNGGAANYSSYNGLCQPGVNKNPIPSTQIIINANVLLGATFTAPEKTNMPTNSVPTNSVPTYSTVPTNPQNSNLNFNQLRVCPPVSQTGVEPITPTIQVAGRDTPSTQAVLDTNPGWWNNNGNQVPANGSVTTGAIFSLINVGVCNNNNSNNNNANDANGNKSCDSNRSMQGNNNFQQQSFNLNGNRAAEVSANQGNHHDGPDQFAAVVQCYLTSCDQGMTVSVQ